MNRRRGFLLAGIHLAVAAVFISWEMDRASNRQTLPSAANLTPAVWQETESNVPFDPCHGKGYVDYFISPQQRLVQIDNLPAWALTGWSLPCPGSWSLAGMLKFHSGGYSFHKYLLVSMVL